MQSKRIATEKVISHVDCTTDGLRTAYVTWDRSDRVTFWLTKHGFLAGPTVPVGPWDLFPTCEFWGSEKHIANTYSQWDMQTQHQEWGVFPSWPENEYLLPEVPLVPIACGSSSDFTDAEVLLVRRVYETFAGQHRLYFNFEPQD